MSGASKTTKKAAADKKAGAAAKRKAAARRVKTGGRAERSGERAIKGPRTLGELMSQALVMEIEAAQRYADFADAMDTHNNREVAALFRKMADIEGKHAAQIMAAMEWKQVPAPTSAKPSWEGFEAPETAAPESP